VSYIQLLFIEYIHDVYVTQYSHQEAVWPESSSIQMSTGQQSALNGVISRNLPVENQN